MPIPVAPIPGTPIPGTPIPGAPIPGTPIPMICCCICIIICARCCCCGGGEKPHRSWRVHWAATRARRSLPPRSGSPSRSSNPRLWRRVHPKDHPPAGSSTPARAPSSRRRRTPGRARRRPTRRSRDASAHRLDRRRRLFAQFRVGTRLRVRRVAQRALRVRLFGERFSQSRAARRPRPPPPPRNTQPCTRPATSLPARSPRGACSRARARVPRR